jgi:hypothetical protein
MCGELGVTGAKSQISSPRPPGLPTSHNASPAGQALFAQELTRTVAPRYQWLQPMGSKDPLYQWLIGDELFGRARRKTGPPSLSPEPWDALPVTLE